MCAGGTETLNDMDLDGVVSGNHASNLMTGQNVVTDGSLSGNAGLATVVQNTGNNVLIQNATIVTSAWSEGHALDCRDVRIGAALPDVRAAESGTNEFFHRCGGPSTVSVTSPKEARHMSNLAPAVRLQLRLGGAGHLLTHHYGQRVSEQEVFVAMFRRGDQAKIRAEGFSLLDMKQYLADQGYQADGFEAPLEALASVGVPAITLVNENGYNHFVVVKGLRDGRVLRWAIRLSARERCRARRLKNVSRRRRSCS